MTKVYESETYDYPTQIQESLAELSSSIGYNLTSLAASGLKGTSLPSPAAPAAPPATQHKTLPHALTRAAHAAAGSVGSSPGGDADRLARALELYAGGWDKVAGARLEQDGAVRENFLHPWQTTLNAAIAVALRARQAVRVSRLELDAAKQTYVLCAVSLGVGVFFDGLLYYIGLRAQARRSRSMRGLRSRMRRTTSCRRQRSRSRS